MTLLAFLPTRGWELTTRKRSVAGFFVLALGLAVRAEAPRLTDPVSSGPATGLSGGGSSFVQAMSADARFIVFTSGANNLVGNGDPAPHLDLFVRDRQLGTTVLVSVDRSGAGGGQDDSAFAQITPDGRWIVFASAAANLVPGDTNFTSDVFLHDLASGRTRWVSEHPSPYSPWGPFPGYQTWFSGAPAISGDGRWIAFESQADNLITGDTNRLQDIFVYDALEDQIELISAEATRPSFFRQPSSHSPGITPDGTRVVFVSSALGLVPGVSNQLGEIFVRDRQAEVTYWASTNTAAFFGGEGGGYACFNAVISANGRYVCYKASRSSSVETAILVFHHDLQTGATALLGSNSLPQTLPSLSADGQTVAYEAGMQQDETNVYLWHAHTGSSTLVSVNWDGSAPGNGPSSAPVLTADARSIVFLSEASDLINGTSGPPTGAKQIFQRELLLGRTALVSANMRAGPSSKGVQGTIPLVTPDGRFVAFDSASDDLVPNDENTAADVFVRDTARGMTELISARRDALPSSMATGHSLVRRNALSADGRFLLFISNDGNLALDDTNGMPDVFVRDLAAGQTLPVSVGSTSQRPDAAASFAAISANGNFAAFSRYQRRGFVDLYRYDLAARRAEFIAPIHPYGDLLATEVRFAISPSGRFIAFESRRARDFPEPFPLLSEVTVVLRDMASGAFTAIRPGPFSQAPSLNPIFSPDGRWLAFESSAAQEPPAGYQQHLYAYDLAAQHAVRLTTWPLPPGFQARATGAVFSANSKRVAYNANQLALVYDFALRTNIYLGSNCFSPMLRGDGRAAAYQSQETHRFAALGNIYVRHLDSDETNLVSINAAGTGPGNGSSYQPLITYDGRYVAFLSEASDLVTDDTNNDADLFVRDLAAGTTMLITRSALDGASAKGRTVSAFLGADGRTIVFQSFAPDLVSSDFNQRSDVFVLRLGSEDTDQDDLDDDWEYAFFGDLTRDGLGDFDADGMADGAEFAAGTNPIDDASVLRVITLTSIGGQIGILWRAVPGRRYRVQYKKAVQTADWADLPGEVIATASTGFTSDSSAALEDKRFYRVLLSK